MWVRVRSHVFLGAFVFVGLFLDLRELHLVLDDIAFLEYFIEARTLFTFIEDNLESVPLLKIIC